MNTSSKPFAVVTGASSGIGFELAKEFARRGYDLLIASGSGAIATAAADIEQLGASVQSVQANLATFNGVEELYEKINETGRPIAAIALNAGVGVGGDFADQTELQDELNLIAVNVTGTVHLAKRVVKDMVAQGGGHILFTASIAATTPTPYEAVYGASKAFVLSFSESLREELKKTGVTVTALMPGQTDTNFFHRADMDDTKVGQEQTTNSPVDVAKQGIDALLAGKDSVIGATSFMTKVQGYLNEILPETLKAAQHAKLSAPGSGEK